jgi:hypothetical protein
MWTNWLFCFSIFVLCLFLVFNIKQLPNSRFKKGFVSLTVISIISNLFFLWHTWGGIWIYRLDFRNVLMYWLSFPDYNIPIQLGIIAMVYLMVPYKNLHFKCVTAANAIFMVSVFFQIRVLAKELPLVTPGGYFNVFYQAQHVLFLCSIFILMIMLVMAIKTIIADRVVAE